MAGRLAYICHLLVSSYGAGYHESSLGSPAKRECRYHYINILSVWQYKGSMSRRTKRNVVRIDWLGVGRRIRELRGFDLTQKEFAAKIGVSQSYLSSMENGDVEIGAAILLRIGKVAGKSIEWLLIGQ